MKSQKTMLFYQVKQMMLEQIRGGSLLPGQRLPSHKVLSRQLGVSEGTISRAISELAREGILKARKRREVLVADPETAKLNGSIAFLSKFLPATADPVNQTLLAILQQRLNLRGYEVASIPAFRPGGAPEWLPAQQLWGRKFASLVAMNIMNLDYLATLKSLSVPVIVLDRDTLDIGLDCVIFDNLSAGYQLTELLIKQGHRQIAFAGAVWPQDAASLAAYDPATLERYQGYRLALSAAGIAYQPELAAFSPAAGNIRGRTVMQELLGRKVPFTAVLCEYEVPRVWDTLRDAGRANDVAVVGWRWLKEAPPGGGACKAHVYFDLAAMGEAAAALLERKMSRTSRTIERVVIPGLLRE